MRLIPAVFVCLLMLIAGCKQPAAVTTNFAPPDVDPVAADFTITGRQAVYDGAPKAVGIRPKAGKSAGKITVYYTGMGSAVYAKNIAAPTEVGSYTVTFNVAAAPGYNAATGLSAGTLVIRSHDEPPQTALEIHFLELGNKYTGDSIYINYGDVDILIDAGSKQASAATIIGYINNHIQDNKLEYVIATHAHEDHIAGFTNTATGVLAAYEIGTIIDFPKTDSTTQTYNNYKTARTAAITRGAVHYTALQCYKNEGGAQREYTLGDGVKLEILYNYYYENNAGSENDYSVCVRIVEDGNQYLFTGDLEKNGEDRLVDYYADNFGGLGHCTLYKGGHHGSITSANEKLMAAITPEYVCVTTCVGSAEYNANPPNVFPSQAFINRIAPYTDKVYLTTYVPDYANNRYESFNGNITFSVSDGNVEIQCGNNNLKLKETAWFINNRTMPAAWK